MSMNGLLAIVNWKRIDDTTPPGWFVLLM